MERSGAHVDLSREKTETLRKSLADRELRECTFSPQVNCSGSSRTLDEFLTDQQRFLNRKKNSCSTEALPKRVPTINSNSAAMMDNKRPKDVYSRLYMLHKKPLMIEQDSETPVRANRERRELRLYAMAKKEKPTPTKEQRPVKEPSTDPLVAQGFNREFGKAMEGVEVVEESKIDYHGLLRVLTVMHFITESFDDLSPRNGTRGLIAKLWSTIKLSTQDFALVPTLKLHLAAILNIRLQVSDKKSEIKELSAKDIKKIGQSFEALYLTRKSKHQRKKEKREDFSFRPALCEESRKLVEKSLENAETTQNRLAELADAMVAKKRALIEYLVWKCVGRMCG